MYDTGNLDEFNRPIRAYVPTVIIIDSIPTLASRDTDGEEEMKGQTDAMKAAKQLKQFFLKKILYIYRV